MHRDEPLRAQLIELAQDKPRYGYRRLLVLMRWASRGQPQTAVPHLSRSRAECEAETAQAIGASVSAAHSADGAE
jgi:hypothetical protein